MNLATFIQSFLSLILFQVWRLRFGLRLRVFPWWFLVKKLLTGATTMNLL